MIKANSSTKPTKASEVRKDKQSKKKKKGVGELDEEEGEMLACLAQYFSKAEFSRALNEANKADRKMVKKKQSEKLQNKMEFGDEDGSDSNPSCDNIDQKEMQ